MLIKKQFKIPLEGFCRKLLQKNRVDEDSWVLIVTLTFSLIFSIVGFKEKLEIYHVLCLGLVQIVMGVLIGKIRGIGLSDFFSKRIFLYFFLILFINISARHFINNAMSASIFVSKWVLDVFPIIREIKSYEKFIKFTLGVVIYLIGFGIPYFVACVIDLYCKDRMSKLKLEIEKKDAEFQIVSHLSHNLRPKINSVKSVVGHLQSFTERNGLVHQSLQQQFYEGQPVELVSEAIAKAKNDLNQIDHQIRSMRDLVTEDIKKSEFKKVNLKNIFEKQILPSHNGPNKNFKINLSSEPKCEAFIHKHSFVESMNNIIVNAQVHGFKDKNYFYNINFSISRRMGLIVIDCKNNGIPLPEEINSNNLLSYGVKSVDSPGDGLGMAYVGKMIKAHKGSFEIIEDQEFNVHFRIAFPKGEKV